MWAALRAIPETITVSAIANQTGIHRSTVLRYLQALTAGGYLDACPAAVGQAGSWRLIKNVGHHAPRVRRDGSPVTQGEVTGQLWLAMVGLKDFDCHDLIQNASIEIPEATAKDYGDSMRSDERLTMMRRGEEIMTSRALENAGALISAMTSLAAAQAQPVPVENRTPIQVITQTSTPMQVEEREVTDARGQRQQQLVISEVVSTGLGARGGAARKRLARDFGITPRGIRR